MKTSRILSVFSYLIAVLTVISCAISILHNEIYQDGAWANAQWLGQDIITLFCAFPFLLIGHEFGIRGGNIRWQMVFAGILMYYAYTYSFFMFAANLTILYLFHLPIFGLSLIGFVITCIQLFHTELHIGFDKKKLKHWIVLYLVVISLLISILWVGDLIAHLTDPAHQSETPDGKAPLIIYSLDLGIIIPLMITAAVRLYRNTQWGLLLCGIMLTKTSTLGFALMAMAVSMYIQNLNPDYFLIGIWCVIGVIGSLTTYFYLQGLQVEKNG